MSLKYLFVKALKFIYQGVEMEKKMKIGEQIKYTEKVEPFFDRDRVLEKMYRYDRGKVINIYPHGVLVEGINPQGDKGHEFLNKCHIKCGILKIEVTE